MKLSVPENILNAIKNDQWVDISYVNKNKEHTSYKIGIRDIDPKSGWMKVDSFNYPKFGLSCDPLRINFNNIEHASAIEQSYYPIPNELKEKIEQDSDLQELLKINELDNNILRYLSDCYKNDNDPFIRDGFPISDIDVNVLLKDKKITLDNDQFLCLLNNVFKKNYYDSERLYRYFTLAINRFSIDINGNPFVVAYNELTLNFKDKTLSMSKKVRFNKTFLINQNKYSLSSYLDISADDFILSFNENERECIESIKYNFNHGEKINTRPLLFLLRTEYQKGVDLAFESIYEMQINNKLNWSLRAFFGNLRSSKGSSKEQNIVIYNKNKINIDQMRVVYNAMVNHVTYVKGPPGTGKTETIFNVLLSSYANNNKVLVCSNNNHPINDIYKRMQPTIEKRLLLHSFKVDFPFPIIRIGNNDEIKDTTLPFLRKMFDYASTLKKAKITDDKLNTYKDNFLLSFNQLKKALMDYELSKELEEKNEILNKIKTLSSTEEIVNKIKSQISDNLEEIKNIGNVNEKYQNALNNVISAKDNNDFLEYLEKSFLLRIKRLNNDIFSDLRDILQIENQDEAVRKFGKYLSDDDNLKRLTDIFPIVVCTNMSSSKLGSPKPNIFDLCIMDEAGQCNIAVSLIPIVRANNLLLVGDTNQLQPVTVLDTDLNDLLRNRYGVKKEYDYIKNSILSTMLNKDNNSKVILLRYHYRCGKLIANFSNQRFYENQLELLNKNPGNLLYYNVITHPNPSLKNASIQEANEIVNIIKRNNFKDVGIVTPFVNQADLINRKLQENNIKNVVCGTIHTLQGSEKKVIIMSAAISLKTSRKVMDWLKNNAELINVAVTRAKDSFIFVGDKKAIDILNGKENSDIKALSDYIYANGKCILPKSEKVLFTDFSNNSENERQFFETIKPYFERKTKSFQIERNVLVKDTLSILSSNDEQLFGQKEFDVVIKAKLSNVGKYVPIIVFEINGGEHIGSNRQIELDRQKRKICIDNNINLIIIDNSQVKDYSLIIETFEKVVKDIVKEEESRQMNIFDSF